MSESKAASTESDLEALKALQADASELERITSLLDRFNIFKALGFGGQEVMHSHFLAFLLNPKQNHGLGDIFLRKMLEKASATSNVASVLKAFEDIGSQNMEQTAVQTEVYTGDGRIDILLLNEVEQWAMIIENKVWSTEHSGQLGRYFRFVKKTYPEWYVCGIYLTPNGDNPSHPEDRKRYLPLSYGVVCEIIDHILTDRGSDLPPDVKMSLEHYVQMVRRRILGDPEIVNLCQEIYQKHKRALDLIYEHRSPQEVIGKLLLRLVKETPEVIFKGKGFFQRTPPKEFISFRIRRWDDPDSPPTAWKKNVNRILGFTFANRPDSVDLKVEVTSKDEKTRKKLFKMANHNPAVFKDPSKPKIPNSIFVKPLLTPESYKDTSGEEREIEIRERWTEFLQNDLPQIEEVLERETWVWESLQADEAHPGTPSTLVWGEGDNAIHEREPDG